MLSGPMSRIISSSPTASTDTARDGALALNSFATTASTGSTISQPCALALARMSRAVSARSCSHSDLPTSLPCAARNVLAMPPPMISTFDLGDQVAEQVELGRDLGAADDRGHRPLRRVERLAERVELGLHAAPGIGRQHVAEAFGRGVRAVRGGERVVDPEVAELRQLRDEGRVVLLLAFVEAGVLQAQDVAGLHRGDRCGGLVADAVLGERDRPPEHARHFLRDRLAATAMGSTPFGRPKCESRITLPPLSAISLMVGACRSMRVASVTLPFSVGTLRSTRTSTRLSFTSASSRVRNVLRLHRRCPDLSADVRTRMPAIRIGQSGSRRCHGVDSRSCDAA